MTETYTINKPHIAEDFIDKLMADPINETDEHITFSKTNLNTCLAKLASEVMAREKHNYERYEMFRHFLPLCLCNPHRYFHHQCLSVHQYFPSMPYLIKA